jgi:hypothetical protein
VGDIVVCGLVVGWPVAVAEELLVGDVLDEVVILGATVLASVVGYNLLGRYVGDIPLVG